MANEKSTSKEVKEESISNKIIGEAYRDLKKLVKRYAHEDMPLLLMGESGTGKELFAKLS